MKLPEVSIRRPVSVIMLTLIVIIVGVISFGRLPIDLLPSMDIPIAVVMTEYPGVGPQEVEKIVTNPIEGVISTVENIDKVSSMTSEGRSIVIAQFNYGTDMNFAALHMREKVDLVKRALPAEVGSPMVIKIDPNNMPIVQLTIHSKETDLAKLQNIAEDKIKPRLERLAGVASINVSGGYVKEIAVRTYQEKLKGYGLSIDYLGKIIGAENLSLPGGKVKKGNQDLTISTRAEFQNVDDIKNLLIPLPAGGTVRLSDIAEVALAPKDLTAITKTDGQNSITISVLKQSGTNTVKVAEAVNSEIEKLKKEYDNISISSVFDQSVYIKKSISSTTREGIIGGILAVLVLYIFFRNVRTTMITATAIPISILVTFSVLYFAGITINVMTLGGLALAVGRLVDDNVVALENIYRHRQEGYSRPEAALKGVSEVGMAIVASTLTIIVVFLPMVFVRGITATIFRQFALTVCISLGASLLVSLTLVPTLASKLLTVERTKGEKRAGIKGLFDKFYFGFDTVFSALVSRYRKLLSWALGHRKTVIAVSTLVFVLSAASVVSVGAQFFPQSDEGSFTINITLPDGSQLDNTNQLVSTVESELQSIPEIKNVFSMIGTNGGFSLGGDTANVGTVYVLLKEVKERKRSVFQIADEVRTIVKDIPGAEFRVSVSQSFGMGGTAGAPVSINIKGDDLDTLKKIANDFKDIVASVEGTREVKTSYSEGVPEVRIVVDRKNASQYGLTAGQIAGAVKGTIQGTTATRFKYDGKEIDVRIKGDDTFIQGLSNLEQTPVQTPAGISVPLGQVAKVTIDRGPTVINRDSQTRVVSVNSQIMNRDLGSITADIEKKLASYEMPNGYSYKIGGENEQLTSAFKDLSMALALAIVLVYMILASQFESLLHPFTIMFSVPMGFSGGMLGLFIARKAFSVPAFIGLILLSGIVVNNAIVLVDYINKRRTYGDSRMEAILNAGPIRLRPILITTLTTVLGLVPLALGIGEGTEAQAPMGIVVIGGLTLSTLSTLVLVPVLYTIFEDFTDFLKLKIAPSSGHTRQG